MTDPINSNNRLRNSGISADSRAGSTAKADRAGADNKSAGAAGQASGRVELSSSTLIEALAEQIRNLPEVNEAKVEAVKTALANGDYHPDAEVIARKYAEIEKLLP